jgi:hypothetical protein
MAVSGNAPSLDSFSTTNRTFSSSMAAGGKGGSGDIKLNEGAMGAIGKCWDFANNVACP